MQKTPGPSILQISCCRRVGATGILRTAKPGTCGFRTKGEVGCYKRMLYDEEYMKHIALPMLALLAAVSVSAADGSLQNDIYRARDRVLPALVHIQPVVKDYNTGELKKQAIVGSGVIFNKDGYVVTNYHVAGKAERIICTLGDREQVSARFIGGDPPTDLAIIKLDLSDHKGPLPVAEFGNSDSVQVGQYVLAMGSPLALSRTVSGGVISTKDRYFSQEVRLPSGEQTGNYNLWIQTDAAINPGNSGGPLVDLDGRVIGINSRAMMFANSIGYAIPVNIVKEVVHAILTEGKVTRSYIGAHYQALQEMEEYFGTDGVNGVLVSSIDAGSPAEEGLLRAGDIIQQMNGQAVSAKFVEELPAFYKKIATLPPGSVIDFRVQRGTDTLHLSVKTRLLGDLQGEDFECAGWDFTVKGITRQMQLENQLKDSLGVFVEGVKRSGAADDGGLRAGDVIVAINKQEITDLPGFVAQYHDLVQAKTQKILLGIKRGGSSRLVVLKPSANEETTLND
ncbi:peptidase S1 [candidate division GN15 bacterium]|uniref:Peptidase S1 n=1 Tax=candidate division GN15 bacterium TaxID=2072418 RepID=A0A855WWX8_9BACT|nr:MAG: peptidase S1 [candidate division GN15 bacterium]